jgi:hypothetical protein
MARPAGVLAYNCMKGLVAEQPCTTTASERYLGRAAALATIWRTSFGSDWYPLSGSSALNGRDTHIPGPTGSGYFTNDL